MGFIIMILFFGIQNPPVSIVYIGSPCDAVGIEDGSFNWEFHGDAPVSSHQSVDTVSMADDTDDRSDCDRNELLRNRSLSEDAAPRQRELCDPVAVNVDERHVALQNINLAIAKVCSPSCSTNVEEITKRQKKWQLQYAR